MKRNLLLSLLSAVVLSLAFPPSKLGFMAYWGLVPLFLILNDSSYKQAMKWGYLTGLFLNMWTLYWISWVTIPGMIAAILYLPLFIVIYAILHTFLRKRLGTKYLYICIPFLWTGIEYLRALGVLGFPWTSLAYTQTYYLSLIQYASFTSIYGITFWVVTINVIVFVIFLYYENFKKVIILFLILISLFLFPWIYGKIIIPENEDVQEKIRVAVVQGNIDPFIKSDSDFWPENFEIYNRLTQAAANHNPQLIIWPETAVPCYLRYTPEYLTKVRDLVSRLKIPLITGAHDAVFDLKGKYTTYNTVFSIVPNSYKLNKYAKLHLVPFGERVPFTEVLPFFKDFLESLELGEGNFSPGRTINTFEIPIDDDKKNNVKKYLNIPVIVCFESLFPELVRKFVIDKDAQILAIITNDGWFKRSAASYHHAQAAIFRAIENRVSIARSANTGISMFIDPYGRTIASSPLFEEFFLVSNLPLIKNKSFFSQYGNVFSVIVTILNLGPLIIALFKQSNDDFFKKDISDNFI